VQGLAEVRALPFGRSLTESGSDLVWAEDAHGDETQEDRAEVCGAWSKLADILDDI